MDRREFGKLLAGAMTFAAMPQLASAAASIGAQARFRVALNDKPWLLGYLGSTEPMLQSRLRITHGRVPDGLSGQFLRNGPARHEIGQDRFMHWFDAPGMIQRFTIADGGISHLGRLVGTARNRIETAEDRIAFFGFGTSGPALSSGGSADGQSPANISLLHHAGELLALWEGGSPHVIDVDTLDTLGTKTWSQETAGLPFGAHPRRDTDGSVWNIGYSADPAAIVIYRLSPDGALAQTHVIPQTSVPMVHDFLITGSKLVLVMPPFRAGHEAAGAFLHRFAWNADAATEFLVIDKADLSNVVRLETSAFWVFHFGNAYDISPTEIGFDFSLHADPGFMTADAYQVMDGSWNGGAGTTMRYAEARIDLAGKTVRIEHNRDHDHVEFIQVDAREHLSTHRHALMLAHSGGAGQLGWNMLVQVDRLSGQSTTFRIGDGELLEEHLIVPKPGTGDDFWIIGTSLDWRNGHTNLSVYEGRALGDGPVVKAALDYPIPFGLHGTFLPSEAMRN